MNVLGAHNFIDLTRAPSVVSLDDDEDYESDASDRTLQDHDVILQAQTSGSRNEASSLPLLKHDSYQPGTFRDGPAFRLRPGDTVEISGADEDNGRGSFLRIVEILENLRDDRMYLRGWLFVRTNRMKGMLNCNLNEVCRISKLDYEDPRTCEESSLHMVDIGRVTRRRRLIITNEDFPKYSFREHTFLDSRAPGYVATQKAISNGSELVCRWRYITITRCADQESDTPSRQDRRRQARRGKLVESALCRISEAESDAKYRVQDRHLTIRSLGYIPRPKLNYTFADAFCGGGGASSGASQAGLTVEWSFDSNAAATETYRRNFPNATVYTALADQISVLIEHCREHHVDVLHISPPCQPYSPINVRHNELLDEMNTATLFSVQELIKRIKPRLITFEETFGILQPRYIHWFNRLVNMITSNGYSVRWRVASLDGYGLCQARKRLILYAACPGSTLPEFPAPTHGPRTSNPYRSLQDALSPLLYYPQATHHDPDAATHSLRTSALPYSPSSPLRNAITCGGGIDAHFSGLRRFTPRELALIQGFKVNYKFPAHQLKTDTLRQIGNAFPPVAAKVFMARLVEALKHEDLNRWDEDVAGDRYVLHNRR